MRAIVLLWLALLGASVARAAEWPSQAVGAIVEDVRFESPAPLDLRDLRQHCPLRPGMTLTAERARDAVRWLELKETFRAVDLVVEMDGDRVLVTFRLLPSVFVTDVQVEGVRALGSETVLKAARVREDEVLSTEKTESAAARVKRLYVDKGYPDAVVKLDAEERAPGEARLTIRVDEGVPRRIGSIDLLGLGDLEPTAAHDLPIHAGDTETADALARGRSALQAFAREHGFYEATVESRERTANAGPVEYVYDVALGPRFTIDIRGNHAIGDTELLALIDLSKRPIVTEGTWKVLAARMLEHYQDEGFRFAKVEVATAGANPKIVTFAIDEGPRVRVAAVEFSGNASISSRTLLAAMQTSPRSTQHLAWLPGRGRPDHLRESWVTDDLERIAALYREAGFPDAQAREEERVYSADRSEVTLRFHVDEGNRRIVDSVEVLGADDAVPRLGRGLALAPGEPLVPASLAGDRETIAQRLGRRGYVEAKIETEQRDATSADGVTRVRIVHRVTPGNVVRVRRVIIQGNHYTHDSVVRRTFGVRAGDPFDPERLKDGQTDVYRLGIFRSVSVQADALPDGSRDVRVRVSERPAGELQYGFGYDTRAGVHNFLQIGHRNVGGRGQQLTLRGDLNLSSTDLVPDEYIVALEGKQPRFLGSRYDLKASVARQQSERSVDEFSIRETSVSLGFEREFLRGLRGTLLVEFEDSDIFDVKPDAVLTGKDVGKLRTVSLDPVILYDGRDDPFAPKRGVFESLRLRYATPYLGSDTEFFKLVAQHSQYVPIGGSLTWIYAGRVGWAKPLRRSEIVPIRDRFFLGGRTSVRGYDENEIGPRGANGHPIGGDFLVNVQTEMRFPFLYGLNAAVFFDAGGLYLQDRSIALGDARAGAGPGLRYETPVGSISLDYGFKVPRRNGESIGEVHFTIGNIF